MYPGSMLSTIVARVLPESSSGRAIGELVSQQTAAYNEAVTRLNRGIFIPKRSSRTNPRGFNKLLTEWRHEEPYRRRIPYSNHQAGWEQAWEANERMREESARRLSRIARFHEEGEPVKKRDARQHRRTLAHRERKIIRPSPSLKGGCSKPRATRSRWTTDATVLPSRPPLKTWICLISEACSSFPGTTTPRGYPSKSGNTL